MPQNGQKLFSTVDDQVTLLKDTKGIQVSNEVFAKDILSRIGYFPLMGGYKHLFRIPLTKNYKPGTSFEEQEKWSIPVKTDRYASICHRHLGLRIRRCFLSSPNSGTSVPTENDYLHSGLLILSQICLFMLNWEYQ